jgi:hypothetical protein
MLPDGFEARVLEPSPPAVNDPEYCADDPAVPGLAAPELTIVTPTTAGDISWDELTRRQTSLAGFTTDRWLGAWKRLPPLPPGYVETVVAINQIAFFAMAPARHSANGKVGLRYTHRGFGTPFFGNDVQVRIETDQLVVQERDSVRNTVISTTRSATEFIGVPYRETWGPKWHDPPAPTDPDQALKVDIVAAAIASDIIGFAFSVLEQFRYESPTSDPSRVQLWPEHFDAAVEIGDADRGQRAAFGVSPGYAAHPEPFVYVSPLEKSNLDDPYWNADFFGGSVLEYSELVDVEDQRQSALEFLSRGLELLKRR